MIHCVSYCKKPIEHRSNLSPKLLRHFIPRNGLILFLTAIILSMSFYSFAADEPGSQGVFDDAKILAGYTKEYSDESKEAIIGRIKDETLSPYQSAAAVRVFKEKYCLTTAGREKVLVEHDLIRLISRSNSAFVDVEIMHTLCLLDRYKYFDAMIPALILKLDHYNDAITQMASKAIMDVIAKGKSSQRDARIIFNTLRKVLFLSRNTLKNVTEPNARLSEKLKILRWSVKILGANELKRLPKEIIHLL